VEFARTVKICAEMTAVSAAPLWRECLSVVLVLPFGQGRDSRSHLVIGWREPCLGVATSATGRMAGFSTLLSKKRSFTI
jgi:hypothetical protein